MHHPALRMTHTGRVEKGMGKDGRGGEDDAGLHEHDGRRMCVRGGGLWEVLRGWELSRIHPVAVWRGGMRGMGGMEGGAGWSGEEREGGRVGEEKMNERSSTE